MLLYPNCKINIGLRIVRKREDGYHDLETIFYPVYGLCDELEVNRLDSSANLPANDDGYIFRQEGIIVDCPADKNLIIKCYLLFKEQFGDKIGKVDIRFRKNIPFGAGLGGGSSDAAHMAIALNELFQLRLTKPELAKIVAKLGADCPFFIYNTPCFAEGIGDILTPIDFSLAGKRLIMIKPDVHVSTKDAYSGVTPNPNSNMRECISLALSNSAAFFWKGAIERPERGFHNDFEKTVFPKYPILGDIKKRLIESGASYAAMSGSGSTIFALFDENAEGGANAHLSLLEQEFSSMIIFNDTLA